MRLACFLSLALVVLTGCSTGFTPRSFIEKPRIIAATLEVQGDAARSTPLPGETVDVTLIAVDPATRVGRTWVFAFCVPLESNLNFPICATEPFGFALSTALPADGEPKPNPSFSIPVPNEATLGDADHVVMLGAVCHGGELNPELLSPASLGGFANGQTPRACADETLHGEIIASRVPVERRPEDRNHSPGIAGITLDGVPWTAVAPHDAPAIGCAGAGYPEYAVGTPPLRLELTATDGSLEPYLRLSGDDEIPDVEVLVLRAYVTAGDVDPDHAFIDTDTPIGDLDVELPASAEVDATGTLLRFYGDFSDERGGAVTFERAICVVPAS